MSTSVTASGVCAIVGRPNVGKSTLLNAIIGEKVAITTRIPQTTRHAIRGILTREDVQIVFVDTPGVHKPKTLLGSRLNDIAQASLSGVDVAVLVVDGAKGIGTGDAFMAELVSGLGVPIIGVLNKVDRIGKDAQLPAIAALADLADFDEIVPVSARRGEQVEVLTDLIAARMPEGPALYPVEMVTDSEEAQRISEIVREKAMVVMREEVPHSIAVTVEEMGPGRSENVTAIFASIYVERDSQKGMVIGRQGAVLAQIGTDARPELEALLGTKVYLDLRVKISKEWQRDPKKLDKLGY
ncbi:GTP-binding protein Era [Euzebya pacifica]|uniref:GTPase Era n=1 Tax=Euzebya pacifica TaxID=1608957 RepID=A0A346XZX7_9ACTN|nr:GTPase Era [Euzebya pacifica]AXV07774.1 GTP-binding protein Era [Euzebya pacifica]